MGGDNFHVEVRSEGRGHFESAIRLAWANAPGGKATHYVCGLPEARCLECSTGKRTYWKDKESFEYPCPACQGSGKRPPQKAMVLLWHEDSVRCVKASQLPFPLTCDAAIDLLWSFLQTVDFEDQPNHDGSNGKGFIVTTGDFWGHVEGSHYAFLGVYPDWQMYGK